MTKMSVIKQDLLSDLEAQGKVSGYYTDLVDDYMAFWSVKTQLIKDIRQNGAVRERTLGTGVTTIENSKSTDQLLKVNAQMLKLLEALGLDEVRAAFDEEM